MNVSTLACGTNQAVKVVSWRVFLAVTIYLQGNTNCVNFQVGEFASPSTMFPARPVEDHLPQIRAWRGFIVMGWWLFERKQNSRWRTVFWKEVSSCVNTALRTRRVQCSGGVLRAIEGAGRAGKALIQTPQDTRIGVAER